MSIHTLDIHNFFISGKSMNINLPGNYLVFFKFDGCKGCEVFLPIFTQLSREDRRISYGIVDLTYNRNIVQMSKPTTTHINIVPHLIIYVQGKPHARFTGEKNRKALTEFLSGVLATVPQHQPQASFVPQQNMYGGPSTQGTIVNIPDSQPPRQASRMATSGMAQAHPSMQKQCDPDDEECLLMPAHITPHNMPWEVDVKRIMGEI